MHTLPKYAAEEFERRWIVDADVAARLAYSRERRIEDRYLQPGRIRLRAVYETGSAPIFKLGKKYRSAQLGREPVVSVYLDEPEYNALSALPGRCSVKLRRTVSGGALDLYLTPAHAFAIYEIEFASAEDAAAFTPPGFVAQEVTGHEQFTGYALAAREA